MNFINRHTRTRTRKEVNRNALHPPPPCVALDALAARVAGLFLSFRDPEQFHLEKHDIATQLHRLADAMRRQK